MCSMIGRPATGTSGFGRLLVSGRRREPSPPAMTTAFTSPTQYDLNSVVEELKQFAYDLLWTWQPRIEALFRTLDPEIWKSTRENSVLPVRKVEGVEVEAPIGTRNVRIAVWRAQVGRVPLFLLDTDLEANPQDLRGITDRLYVPEPDRRLRQEIVLGIGGVRALRALGIDSGVFHLNEGHSFLCAIERIRELRASRQMTLEEARLVARAGIVFTTHTPIAAGSDYFDSGLVWDLLGPYLSQVGISFDRFMDLGRQRPGDPRERLWTTYAALGLADQSVGVSRLHGAVSRRLWKDAWKGLPENQVPIGSVTNGVHMPTWVAPEIADLLTRFVGPGWWDLDPAVGRWHAVDEIPTAGLWAVHGTRQG